jgi:carboxypeptidase Taq
MTSAWSELEARMRDLNDLFAALRLLNWDQAVMMPPRGAPARARSIATLEGVTHERLTDPRVGELLEELGSEESLELPQRASVRVLHRDYEQATKVPSDLVRAIAEARGLAYAAWTEARPASDFSILAPRLERLIALKKEEADALGWEQERYDALLDLYEPGLTTQRVESMFGELVAGLEPIVDARATDGDPGGLLGMASAGPQRGRASTFDEERQEELCRWLATSIGFDASAGRLDQSPHPFTAHIGTGDVRQTTRTDPRVLLSSVYAALHETGHALYEQGLPEELLDLPAGRVPSLGLHESQSRLWENQVGRSRPFCNWLLPHLKERFPEEIGMVTPEQLYEAVNHVSRTLVRVEADEVTYNLHIAHRFELELAVFRDELDLEDAPEAWNAALERYVGVRPPDDAAGILQDMHWSIGALGYFPTYTIGNLYAAALFARAEEALGGLEDDLSSGDCSRLLGWLRDNVHARAYLVDPDELMTEVVGEVPGSGPLLSYLEAKYGGA